MATTDKPPNSIPNAAQRGQLIAALAQVGFTGQQLAAVITANKPRSDIWRDMNTIIRNLPKSP